MSSIKVACVIKEKNEIGESPIWEEKDSSLVYVDITGQRVSRWSSLTGHIESITTEKPVGSVVLRKAGGYVIAEGTRFAFVDWVKRSITTAVQLDKEKPNTRFNDGKVDPAGRFFAGTMGIELRPAVVERKQGSLYTLHPDRSVVHHFLCSKPKACELLQSYRLLFFAVRFWWLKLKALAEKGDWEELEKFAKSKKSPIGYLPFVEVCIKHHNKHEASKYVSRVTPEQKVKAHLAVGDLQSATEAAIERRNESEIITVLSRCSATTDVILVERLNRAKATAAKK
ncbi:regucalcin-like [Triplophysa rosa]|uniref:regucalcin-like n=1 Tax=Triplophysa rosa TaxID=992332 RepID=UPI002546234F|nr:regucalcin-like [Triplophysa rosa]